MLSAEVVVDSVQWKRWSIEDRDSGSETGPLGEGLLSVQ